MIQTLLFSMLLKGLLRIQIGSCEFSYNFSLLFLFNCKSLNFVLQALEAMGYKHLYTFSELNESQMSHVWLCCVWVGPDSSKSITA